MNLVRNERLQVDALPISGILATKLHPPKRPAWWVEQGRAAQQLEQGRHGTATVVSAPAGYGKSTCVAAWLTYRDESSAWLSLDSGDDDLAGFVRYLLAAVRGRFPGACRRTRALLESGDELTVAALAHVLTNELDAIGTPFVVVLDDYHVITQRPIHDLLATLLVHPPRDLHLVVITRHDLPVALASLRTQCKLGEVRLADLQFGRTESTRFLSLSTGLHLSERSLAHLELLLEGWPVGLHLVSLALRTREDPEAFLRELHGPTHLLQDYLAQEVIGRLPEVQQRWLIRSSVLTRFSAPLCEAVCADGDGAATALDGSTFVETLQSHGLFVIALDAGREWYRYHPTFRGWLQERFAARHEAAEVAALQSRAARWCAEHELPDEAISYALAARDHGVAASLIHRYRSDLVNQEQWSRLEHWLSSFRELSAAEQDPSLLVAMAWSCEHSFRSCARAHLDSAQALLDSRGAAQPGRETIQAEIDALRAHYEYALGSGASALALVDRALSHIAPGAQGVRAYALAFKTVVLQSLGDRQAYSSCVRTALDSHAADPASGALLLTGLAFAQWLDGDLVAMKRSARRSLELAEEHRLNTTVAFARYLLGIFHYARGEHAEAAANLEVVIENRTFAGQAQYFHSVFVLALTQLAQGNSRDAQQTIDSLCEYALNVGDGRHIELAHAFEADLDLRRGRKGRSVRWAQTCPPEPFQYLHLFYIPQLTLAKAWLADGGEESRRSALNLLDRLIQACEARHNVPIRIQALCLRALAGAQIGDGAAALAALVAALGLAAPGGMVHPFTELGAPMAALLRRVPPERADPEHLRAVLARFPLEVSYASDDVASSRLESSEPLGEPLTNRQHDVLLLLAQRLRDKEIAERLFISPGTVKSHLKELYQKLGVSGRREAVERARALGIAKS